jgi:hypothetical protein
VDLECDVLFKGRGLGKSIGFDIKDLYSFHDSIIHWNLLVEIGF